MKLYEERVVHFGKEKAGFEQRIAELEASSAEKDKLVAQMEEKETVLKSKGRKVREEWEGANVRLEEEKTQVAQLKAQMQVDQAKANKMSATLIASQAEKSSLENSLEQIKQQKALLDQDLKVAEARLEEVNSYYAELTDINADELANEFKRIWVSITELVRKYVGEDLPDSMLTQNWEILNNNALSVDKTLPQSNSDIAKELRVVTVLYILANAISEYLLQPTYQSPEYHGSFEGILYNLASIEPKRERALRAMLLAVLEPEREEFEDQLASRVVDEVMQCKGVSNVIRADLKDEFLSNLDEILCDIMDIWQKVQYSNHVFISSFEPTQASDFAWGIPTPSSADASQVPAYVADNDVVVLFPKMARVDDAETLIAAGTVVRKSQLYAFVKEERNRTQSAEPGPSRPRQRQSRTASMSNGTRIFLPRPAAASNAPSRG
ncbi:hypothetical protein N0V95_007297 [Ascochyta clinopodiicola]|nr:hypothetical protein N0V95_007297 [Ascochyta clinopodiicola]